jgi:hypothetical protein
VQHDFVAAVLSPFFIIGHLSPQQPALPSFDIMGHFPSAQHAILPSFMAFMSHLPSLQQPPSLPQHDVPLAIFPSFIIGHLSPGFMLAMSCPQHGHALDLSPAAGAAGVAVCAIITSANIRVIPNTIHFVFMISSFVEPLLDSVSGGAPLQPCISRPAENPRLLAAGVNHPTCNHFD